MANVDVSSESELASAILAAVDGDTITFTADIVLTADLPAIQAGIAIDGAGFTLYGTDPDTVDAPSFRGLFVYSSGADGVVIEDLTISGAVAKGGDGARGAGGGAGMGGALFVAEGATVTVIDVAIVDGAAVGGNGNALLAGGGGGGMGGHGSASVGGGGGGLGSGATGGASGGTPTAGSTGIVDGAAPGGDSDAVGGQAGGGGGGGGSSSGSAAGGGGGIDGGDANSSIAGNGGFGGGGGGAGSSGTAGDGGFGGGGGSAGIQAGDGGYGGGGGRAVASGTPGTGGFGGGDASTVNGHAGGGAGMGGGVFVMDGGTLVIGGGFSVSGNTVAGGDGGNEDGQAFASGIYLHGGSNSLNTLTFEPDAGETQTISDDIFDEQGLIHASGYVPPADFAVGAWDIFKTGAGTLVLTGTTAIGGILDICGCDPANTLKIDGGSMTALFGTSVEGGTLELVNGGTLETDLLLLSGIMKLDGASTRATSSELSLFSVDNGAGLLITGGARLEQTGDATIDGVAAPINAAVTGTASTWDVAGTLSVGVDSDFAIEARVTSGATISADRIVVGETSFLVIGQGGLAGAIITDSIENDGKFLANFTDTATVSADISGSGQLIKASSGTLILTGASTYVGATTVSRGVLQVDGSIVSATTVSDGGVLGGTGTVGSVAVDAGGRIAAGNSAGILKTGSMTLVNGAFFEAELGGTVPGTGGYDQIRVNGKVVLGGATLEVSLLDTFAPKAGSSFTIVDNDGVDAVVGTFDGLAEGATFALGTATVSITYVGGDGNDVVLSVQGAPPQDGVTIAGTDGRDVVDASRTVPGEPLPTEFADLIHGYGGKDQLSGLGGNDTIYGGQGGDLLHGNAGDDVLYGKRGKDTLWGDAGNDTLKGGRGGDILYGGDGDDVLIGGRGKNVLHGGEGSDTFVFRNAGASDTIKDFADSDVIALAKSAFLGLGPKGMLKAKYFHAGAEAETQSQHVLYDAKSGWLLYARNGSHTANPHKLVKVGKDLDGFDHHDILVI